MTPLPAIRDLWAILEPLRLDDRYAALVEALSFGATASWQPADRVGRVRAAFSNAWEMQIGTAIPFKAIGGCSSSTVVRTQLWAVCESSDLPAFTNAVRETIVLFDRITATCVSRQHRLFNVQLPRADSSSPIVGRGVVVKHLEALIESGKRFPTIYADPPWPYDNEVARGAAANHYPVMSLDAIRREPVDALAAKHAHLHLWTTNGFLREALELIADWGFRYKSCLVWIKPDFGCGNYWRVSHEYLLLGVRGRLPFRDRCQPSWLAAPRLEHSRKPGRFRLLVERVSPGPYLELYGRAAMPDSDWTVYGNQVERRLF